MSTPNQVAEPTEQPTAEKPSIGAELAAGLRALATAMEASPALVEAVLYTLPVSVLVPAGDKDSVVEIMRAAKEHGATIAKHNGDKYFSALCQFGPKVQLDVYVRREEVCERVVVGTREVTEEVPDPEALAAVPTVQQTRTEDIVEWKCRPLLAEDGAE